LAETSGDNPDRKGRKRSLAIIGFMACITAIYLMLVVGRNDRPAEEPREMEAAGAPPATARVTKALSRGAVAGFLVRADRPAVPAITFADGTGKQRSLSEWRGRVVLLNLWATWCGPCREEMPELARLQARLGSPQFEVVALSLDRGGADVARRFLSESNATQLQLYVDPSSSALRQLAAIGLPVSVLIDRQGKEIGRLLGPARWASEEAMGLVQTALREPQQAG
jgi:thiol-disulfide isomerase/thioredoxin